MQALCVSKVKLTDLLDQVLDSLCSEFLQIFKLTLENELLRLRDDILRTRRYQRGNVLKRWGFTVRKWIQTPLGLLSEVRIPRIRSYAREVSLFCDRYVKRSGLMNALFLEMFLWGMSSRRLSVLSAKLYRSGLTASSICRLKRLVADRVAQWRQRRVSAEIGVLVVDGVYGRFRERGKAVCLMAIGVDRQGHAHLLDWQGAQSESTTNWRRLFRRLYARGLTRVELVVSDHAAAITEAMRSVWGRHCRQQLCLWHFSREVGRLLSALDPAEQRAYRRDFWELFGSLDVHELQQRWEAMKQKWRNKAAKAVLHVETHLTQLVAYYDYPSTWRHRLRTVNLAEGFFSQLQNLMRRYPGWVNEEQLLQIVGLQILGMKVFQHNKNHRYTQGATLNILNMNFNRIT